MYLVRLKRARRACSAVILVATLGFTSVRGGAATTEYQYDALGRLRQVVHDNGMRTDYTLDPVGNRTNVAEAAQAPPGIPVSITVPSSSSSGAYPVSWGAASGTVVRYELFESSNASFTPETPVQLANLLAWNVMDKANGTYYYRVRACSNLTCSGFRTASNSIAVSVQPPGIPPSITVPAASGGYFHVSWGAASGSPSRYELQESTSNAFTTSAQMYSGPLTIWSSSLHVDATYYLRVRACNTAGCSSWRTGSNGVVVVTPPPEPTGLGYSLIANCSWRATWTAVSGAANYVVRDTTGNEQTVTSTQAYVTCPLNNQNANKPKWVKACSSVNTCSSTADF